MNMRKSEINKYKIKKKRSKISSYTDLILTNFQFCWEKTQKREVNVRPNELMI